jgi:predicted DCC family thiol-disulfide oxidoreductase YuxK
MRTDALLVFDGDCAFCTTWVRRLERVLQRFPDAQPWQWLDLGELDLSQDDVTRYVWLIVGERRFRGHAAFAALLRMQDRWSIRFVGRLLVAAPFSWAAALGYSLIARFRHRLPGGTAACAMPRAS